METGLYFTHGVNSGALYQAQIAFKFQILNYNMGFPWAETEYFLRAKQLFGGLEPLLNDQAGIRIHVGMRYGKWGGVGAVAP